MTRSEFEKLSHSDRAAFMKSGKLQDDPKPAKPQTDRAGNLTRDGFRNLAPAKQSAYIKNGGKLVD